ncbi:PREDICTED: doublesex- and mab-3-related transcription factor 1A-like [Trachymyrmex septentrionalis]|uniref:doublesex- and mab-3-related transcription factor 1A-like n=1 Tax=Trachymyrmex septentrionalis TaxID=34720 RepID=UPI00084F3CEB|nr:PREDICTED: doublesex- and mab-3-related transcription factor 1A-like [Trachymyrmex septentrionalis]
MGKAKKRISSLVDIPRTESGRKKPMCGRCDVHGLEIVLEGHKKYCKYQKCTCTDCYYFLAKQRIAADEIARKRANKLSKEKEINHEEMLPLSLPYPPKEDNGLSSLLKYTLQEMYKSFSVWHSPAKIERILRILVTYAHEIDSRIKFNGFLESTKYLIFQVIYQAEPMSFMTFQQATTCCYVPPILHTPYKEQLDGIKSQYFMNLEYPSPNFPVWSSNFLSMTTTNTSLETLKSPSELSVDSFIDSSAGPSTDSFTEPFPDTPTDLSTKSSTYC